MTTLLRCTIEDETGLITDRILSEAEFQDWVARRLGLYEYHEDLFCDIAGGTSPSGHRPKRDGPERDGMDGRGATVVGRVRR